MTTTELEAISLTESKRLVELEGVIKLHGVAFIAVGDALTEIKERKLYRSEYATFELYCQEVWGWSSSRSRQLCAAAAFAKAESVTTGNTFSNEREARQAMKAKKEASQPKQVIAKTTLDEASEPTSLPEPEQPAALKGIDVSKLDGAKVSEPTELEQIQQQLKRFEEQITRSDLTGDDLILIAKEIFKLSKRINRVGKNRQASEQFSK